MRMSRDTPTSSASLQFSPPLSAFQALSVALCVLVTALAALAFALHAAYLFHAQPFLRDRTNYARPERSRTLKISYWYS